MKNVHKEIKTFVFEREDDHHIVIVDKELDAKSDLINLNNLLSTFCPIKQNIVSIYHPTQNQFIEITTLNLEAGYVSKQLAEPRNILIRYRSKVQQDLSSGEQQKMSHFQQNSSNQYDKRSKERNIGEVLQLVKKWRNFHKNYYKNSSHNKKINLQESAKMVGISKKSLDDYYSQLRLAEKYGFNFKDNLQKKIGMLRCFVKEHKEDSSQQKVKIYKLPKKLKIIQSDILSQSTSSRMSSSETDRQSKMAKILSRMIPQKKIKYLQENLNRIQRQFYQQYEYFKLQNNFIDPFMPFSHESKATKQNYIYF